MIKKILSTLLVSSALFVFAATGSHAERPTFAIGFSAAFGAYQGSGTEFEGSLDPREETSIEESGAMGYSSLFIEMSFADRVTVGASWMMDEVETDLVERTDSTEGDDADTGVDEGTSSAKAEFSNLTTGYIEVNIWNGLYAKYGIMEMDVETKESLNTDSAYPNTSMDGETYGLGWKGSFDNGVFVKTETMMQDWSDIKLEATGATGTDNNTSIEASLSGAVATVSIGKAF